MRAISFITALAAGACTLLFSGCTMEHPGPAFAGTDGALPSSATTTSSGRQQPASSKTKLSQNGSPASAPVTPNDIFPGAAAYENDNKPASPSSEPPPSAPLPDSGAIPESPSGPAETDGITADNSGFDNLEVMDPSLNAKLGIQRVGSEPDASNLLSVFVGLKNKTAHPLDLEMETLYKDKAGNALNTGSWIPMTLKPHEETVYRSASISEAATDFFVRVRPTPPDATAGAN